MLSRWNKRILLTLCGSVILIAVLVESDKPADAPRTRQYAEARRPHSNVHLKSSGSFPAVPSSTTPAAEARADLVELARMRRMAENLAKPELSLAPAVAARLRQDWLERFCGETNCMARMEIVTEMPQLDDAQTVRALLTMLHQESDSGVRQQIVLILGFMRATAFQMKEVGEALQLAYTHASPMEERRRILEVVSNLPTTESVRWISAAFAANERSPEERLAAAAGLFKLAPRVAIEREQIRQATAWLQTQARSAPDGRIRLEAARVLAAPGQDNREFLATLLAFEPDTTMRQFLALATQPFPTQ